MAGSARRSRLETTFGRLWWSGLLALVGLSALDAALVGVRAGAWLPVPGYLATALAASSWLAVAWASVATLPLIAASALARRGGEGSERAMRGVGFLASALATAALAVLLAKPWELADTWPYWAFPTLAAVASGVLAALDRLGRSWLLAAGLVTISLAALGLDAWAYRRLYLGLHAVLFLVAFSAAAAAVWRLSVWPSRRAAGLTAAVLVASHAALLFDSTTTRQLADKHGTVLPKTLASLSGVVDWDRDGHSAFFGGGDCSDFDAEVVPGACEIEGNGRDDNCNGLVDATSSPEPRRGGRAVGTRGVTARGSRPDVYLVVVDTLRADFGSRGELGLARDARRRLAPEVGSFAESALDFDRAYTPYPSTHRAMIAMLQSRYHRHVHPRYPLLTSWLGALGYDVQLWIREQRLSEADAPVVGFDRRTGDPFVVRGDAGKGEWTDASVRDALAELQRPSSVPRFRWLHWLDPHSPLTGSGRSPIDRYRQAVRHVSAAFGRLIRGLNAHERGRRAVVVLLADHGDEFGDHGARFHGATLYQENVHVPLLMHLPGVPPRRVTSSVSLIDLAPTLADYLGEAAPDGWRGESLLDPESPGRAVFSQVEPVKNLGGQGRPELHAVMLGRHKLVWNLDRNLRELFDLEADPFERANLTLSAEAPAGVVRSLARRLAEFQDLTPCRAF